MTGTARYTSINTHLGIEQSRRDDIEGLGYVFIYFLRGNLPWQGLVANNKKEKYHRIVESKLSISTEELCAGYPSEFSQLITYAKNLAFEDCPDYAYLKRMLSDILIREGQVYDNIYDWMSLSPIRSQRKSSTKPEELEKYEEIEKIEESKEIIKDLEVKNDI